MQKINEQLKNKETCQLLNVDEEAIKKRAAIKFNNINLH